MTQQEIKIDSRFNIEDLRGKYAYNENWGVGGIIQDGHEKGVCIGGNWYYTETGDCLYDSLTINGFKVYEPE
jgi:hypothetical protein